MKKEQIRLSLSLETKKKLRVLAALEDTNMSEIVADLVERAYEAMRFPPVPPAPITLDPNDL